MEATARAVIDRPIEDVWAYVSNLETMADWVDGVSDVVPPEGELTVGSRFSSSYSYRGKTFDIDYEVTAFDPPNRLDISSREGPFPFDGSLRLADADVKTEVANTIDAGSDGMATTIIFTLFGPIVRRMMRRQLADELDLLADAVEDQDGSRVAAAPAA